VLAFIPFPTWLKPEIIPGLPIRWYGLMYLVAFSVAYQLVKLQVREKALPVDKEAVLNLFFWGIIGLLVGARLFAVTLYDPSGYYLSHPLQIILPARVRAGRVEFTGLSGMSYHGGLAGAVIAMSIYLRLKRMDVLAWGDMIIAGVPLGYTFGRLGNFINGELYGRITTLPWGMVFPQAREFPAKVAWVREFAARAGLNLSGLSTVNLPRHPSQLYEAFFEGLILWLILWFGLRKRSRTKGGLLGWYLIGYGAFRFLIEYLREPDADIGYPIQLVSLENPSFQFSPWNFTTGQILCLLMILAGAVCLAVLKRLSQRASQPAPAKPKPRKLRKQLR